MRSVAYVVYFLFITLTSFHAFAHDASVLSESESFIQGRIVEVDGILVLNVPYGERMASFRISSDLRYFKDQNVSVSGYAELDYFTVQSVITKPNTWTDKGLGQGIQLQGRIVPRPNGGLDFYPIQKRAVDFLGGQKSFPIQFPADLHPPDVYVHLATIRGIISDGKLISEVDYRYFQINLRRPQIAVGDKVTWSGTLVGGESIDEMFFARIAASDPSMRPKFGYEMQLPTNFHVWDSVTMQMVPAELMTGGGFSASLAPSVGDVELLKKLTFTGKLESNHHFLIENVTDEKPGTSHVNPHESALMDTPIIKPPVDRKGLQIVGGDRQRLSEERRCEIEIRRSQFKVVK